MAEEEKGWLARMISDRNERMENVAEGRPEDDNGLAAPAQPEAPVMQPDEEFEALLDASPISARRYLQERYDSGVISPEQFEALKARLPEKQQQKLKSPEQESASVELTGAQGLAQVSDPEFDSAFEGEEPHPGFKEFEGTEAATEEEENALVQQVVKAREFIFNEDNYPKVLSSLNTQQMEFFEAAAETSYQITLSQHTKDIGRGRQVDSSLYFGKGGLIENMVDTMFEIGQQHQIVGSDDPNQYAGAMGYAFQKAGEYIMESGDEASILEAQELMMDVALTKRDGTKAATREEADALFARKQQASNVQQGVQQGMQQEMSGQSFATPNRGQV